MTRLDSAARKCRQARLLQTRRARPRFTGLAKRDEFQKTRVGGVASSPDQARRLVCAIYFLARNSFLGPFLSIRFHWPEGKLTGSLPRAVAVRHLPLLLEQVEAWPRYRVDELPFDFPPSLHTMAKFIPGLRLGPSSDVSRHMDAYNSSAPLLCECRTPCLSPYHHIWLTRLYYVPSRPLDLYHPERR